MLVVVICESGIMRESHLKLLLPLHSLELPEPENQHWNRNQNRNLKSLLTAKLNSQFDELKQGNKKLLLANKQLLLVIRLKVAEAVGWRRSLDSEARSLSLSHSDSTDLEADISSLFLLSRKLHFSFRFTSLHFAFILSFVCCLFWPSKQLVDVR